MRTVSVEALEAKGYSDPVGTFKAIALAGGFGAVDPSHQGGLDVGGIEDAKAKAAIEKILKDAEPKGAKLANNGNA